MRNLRRGQELHPGWPLGLAALLAVGVVGSGCVSGACESYESWSRDVSFQTNCLAGETVSGTFAFSAGPKASSTSLSQLTTSDTAVSLEAGDVVWDGSACREGTGVGGFSYATLLLTVSSGTSVTYQCAVWDGQAIDSGMTASSGGQLLTCAPQGQTEGETASQGCAMTVTVSEPEITPTPAPSSTPSPTPTGTPTSD